MCFHAQCLGWWSVSPWLLVPSCFCFGGDRYGCDVVVRHADCHAIYPQLEGTGVLYQARKEGYSKKFSLILLLTVQFLTSSLTLVLDVMLLLLTECWSLILSFPFWVESFLCTARPLLSGIFLTLLMLPKTKISPKKFPVINLNTHISISGDQVTTLCCWSCSSFTENVYPKM